MLNAWIKGWSLALSQKKIILVYYVSSLIVLVFAIIPFFMMHNSFGSSSLLIQEGFDNFDYFSDVTNNLGNTDCKNSNDN